MRKPAEAPAGSTDDRGRGNGAVALVIALLACAALVVAVKSSEEEPAPTNDARPAAQSSPAHVNLKKLPASTTATTVAKAPLDDAPTTAPSGTVAHPRKVAALYAAPDRKPFAKIAPTQFGDTWLPVIDDRDGWVKVLLPSKPNGSTGWLRADEVDQAHTPYLIRVHLTSRTLEIQRDGARIGRWEVAVGATDTPTPTGRTFVLGQLIDPDQSFSPVILPLGTHSQTLDTYGGGPGTVAFHGWTDPEVFGQAVSHGCVRVPDDALEALRDIPLGTPVLIDNT